MTETTQDYRDVFRRAITAGQESVVGHDELLRLLNDADRLARLEADMRALADTLKVTAKEHERNRCYTPNWRYEEGRRDQAKEDARYIRALLEQKR